MQQDFNIEMMTGGQWGVVATLRDISEETAKISFKRWCDDNPKWTLRMICVVAMRQGAT